MVCKIKSRTLTDDATKRVRKNRSECGTLLNRFVFEKPDKKMFPFNSIDEKNQQYNTVSCLPNSEKILKAQARDTFST